jgi:hypothetical protein
MVGTAVALSNALGLNRDPSSWNIRLMEKRFRVRIWWRVVVHDSWYEGSLELTLRRVYTNSSNTGAVWHTEPPSKSTVRSTTYPFRPWTIFVPLALPIYK